MTFAASCICRAQEKHKGQAIDIALNWGSLANSVRLLASLQLRDHTALLHMRRSKQCAPLLNAPPLVIVFSTLDRMCAS